MKKTKFNALVDILMTGIILFSVFSGWVLAEKLHQGGFRGGSGVFGAGEFFSFNRSEWLQIHSWTSWLIAGLIFLHLVFHWPWIRNFPSLLKK